MKSVDHFLEKLGTTPKRLVVSGAVALQALLSLSADSPALDKKEALSLRKITEYWREGNYQNAKTQILAYITTYPESPYLSELYTMLGDLYFQEKDYGNAVNAYDKITSQACKEFISLRCMESFFLLGKYNEVIACAQQHPLKLDSSKDKLNRFFLLRAESLYRVAIQMDPGLEQRRAAYTALEAYKQVKDDPAHHGALATAHLYALAGESNEAATRYLALADVLPEKQEELYFRAASQLVETAPERAAELFLKVIGCKGDFQSNAAFNRLTLLYKQKCFGQFNEEYDQFSTLLKDEHTSSLLFCRCISLFQLNRFADCIAPLQAVIHTGTLPPLQMRQALLSLFFCAQKTDDLELISATLPLWATHFPMDEGYLRGLFVKAQIALNKKNAPVAGTALQEILERFPTCEERQSVLFDYAQSLVLGQDWRHAREAFQQFIKEYATSPSTPLAWEHLIFCSMQLLKEASGGEKDALKGCLILDLQAALESVPSLAPETLRVYQLGIAQLYFELGQHQEALAEAEDYMQNYSSDPDAQSIRLIATACHVMLHSPPESFIPIAEETLLHETNAQAQSRLRLQLFNAYLTLADKQPAALEKAGAHLLAVYQAKNTPLKRENLLWLADHLGQKSDIDSKNIAIAILEETLPFDGSKLSRTEAFDPSLLENYALRLASLYEDQKMTEKAHVLLASLVQLADDNASDFWQQRRHVLFSLAQLKEKLGENDQALSVYTRLIDEAAYASASYYRRAALLKRAELQFAALPPEEQKRESESVISILDTLKELQITKSIHSEPIHLEAALDYVAIRSSFVNTEEQPAKSRFYLEKMKEDFMMQTDQLGQHYHEQRVQTPDQDAVYSAYMRFIDVEIKRLTALEERRAGNQSAASHLEEEAKQELLALLTVQTVEKTPLVQRIQLSLEQIRSK